MIETLLDPYRFEFFQNGVIVSTVAGALCGFIGCFVVLRSMSSIGHGLSHAIFGGFVASSLIGINVYAGAGLWGLAAAVAISAITRRRPVGSDAAIGVVTTASFALGLVLVQRFGSGNLNAEATLFGNVLGVTRTDVAVVSSVAVVAVIVVTVLYRELLFVTFDPEVAAVSGVAVGRVDAVLMILLAAAILVTMNVLGVTLIAAAIVVPAVVARLLTASFSTMLVLASGVGAAMGFVGMNGSYHADVASGPVIVLVGAGFFLAAFALSSFRPAGALRSGAAQSGQ